MNTKMRSLSLALCVFLGMVVLFGITDKAYADDNITIDKAMAISESTYTITYYNSSWDDDYYTERFFTFTPAETTCYSFVIEKAYYDKSLDTGTSLHLYKNKTDAKKEENSVSEYVDGPNKRTVLSQRLEAGHTYYLTVSSSFYDEDKELSMNLSVKRGDRVIDHFKAKKEDYEYNKKNHRPTISIYNGKGIKIPKSDYTVTYPKSSKDIGIYYAVVRMKNNYEGTYKVRYNIIPSRTSIRTLKGEKGKITVKWKPLKMKMSKRRINGYEIWYEIDDKKLFDCEEISVKGYKKASKTIKKLRKNKKYIFSIRTYVDINGVRLYSKWSKNKSVKTK